MKTDNATSEKAPSEQATRFVVRTEEQLLRAYVSSLLSTSPMIDKFSTWLFAGSGASATLLIANVDGITRIASLGNIKWALLLLILSGLFGFLEKYLATDIQVNLLQEKNLRDILAPLAADYRLQRNVIQGRANLDGNEIEVEIDIKKVLNQYAIFHPWPIRRRILNADPLPVVLRKNIDRYYRQLLYAVAELISFAAFVVLIAFSI